ncbi:hypothetical protein [Clostridium perfringens]|uniref:hypothetical protein n=1 Tax=Clostridium perfringens TaxID=1502 RepID=UPI002971ECD9|nr:hypothetical protein [Clostridium perfringens]MDM0494101.1 hypothetical protein [Clostridium perfringens]
MRKAVYVEGNEKKIILANCITKSEYEKIYKKNLVCPIDGCKAKLGFREVKKQRDGKYFYTLPNNKHADGCPYKIQKKRRRVRRKIDNNLSEDFSQISFEIL